MSEPSHIRAVSFILALSALVGGWLLLDYSGRSSPESTPPDRITPGLAPNPSRQEPPTEMVENPPSIDRRIFPENMAVTYKCEKGGHVSFGDKPCGRDEKTLSITAAERAQPAAESNTLKQMKARAIAMEAARHERDRGFDLASAAIASNVLDVSQNKALRCEQIDKAIASCDSILRQPHSASDGDYWTGKRRKLTDERYSIGC